MKALVISVTFSLSIPVFSGAAPQEAWTNTNVRLRYWEYKSGGHGRLEAAASIGIRVTPGDTVVEAIAFNSNGDPALYRHTTYTGRDSTGISVERVDDGASQECVQGYTIALKESTGRYPEFLVTCAACKSSPSSPKRQSLHLPLPPTSLDENIGGAQLTLTLTADGDSGLVVAVKQS